MCFTVTIRQTPEGLVQEHPLPARPVLSDQSSTKHTSQAASVPETQFSRKFPSRTNDASYTDPFAELPLSSVSTSNDNQSASAKAQPKAKTPVKQQVAKRKQPTTASDQTQKEGETEDESEPKLTRTVPLTVIHKNIPDSVTERGVPTLRKSVSFSDQLNRGPGRSYTPSIDEKAARFAPELVRGKGLRYSDLSPKEAEVYPFARSTSNTIDLSGDPNRESSDCIPKPTLGKASSTKQLHSANMGVKDRSKMQATQWEFDIASDSDNSFVDLVIPITPTKDNASQHRDADLKHYSGSSTFPTSKKISSGTSRSIYGKFSSDQHGFQSEVGDNESFIGAATTENTRRNSLRGLSADRGRHKKGSWKDTRAAPVSNRYGHRLRTTSVGSSVFDHSIRRSWPQPVFVWSGKNPPCTPGLQTPVFALRSKSSSYKPATATSTKQQAKRRYQPPSVIDDEADDAI